MKNYFEIILMIALVSLPLNQVVYAGEVGSITEKNENLTDSDELTLRPLYQRIILKLPAGALILRTFNPEFREHEKMVITGIIELEGYKGEEAIKLRREIENARSTFEFFEVIVSALVISSAFNQYLKFRKKRNTLGKIIEVAAIIFVTFILLFLTSAIYRFAWF